MYRIVIGLVLSCLYLLIFSGSVDWFESFNLTQAAILDPKQPTLTRATSGLIAVYLMALASVYFITFAQETHQILLGYYLVFISFAIFYAF